MIRTREELKYYLECDRIALNYSKKKPNIIGSEIWKYQIILRRTEYYVNSNKNIIGKIIASIYNYRLHKKGLQLGFSIPTNVFGPGLAIAHIGTIVVNRNAKIGKNCRIHEGVTIGANGLSVQKSASIGDNVFIGSGVKIIGEIVIADGISIGAGSVVVNNHLEKNITIGGNTAKKISSNGSSNYLIKATEICETNYCKGSDVLDQYNNTSI